MRTQSREAPKGLFLDALIAKVLSDCAIMDSPKEYRR